MYVKNKTIYSDMSLTATRSTCAMKYYTLKIYIQIFAVPASTD